MTTDVSIKKGLDALFDNTVNKKPDDGGGKRINILFLEPSPLQPRRKFDEEKLQELANSIKSEGIIQPIIVREVSTNKYEIIAGERRWRAAQIAGLSVIPVIISNVSDKTVLAFSLIENIQREDLNALEEALAYRRLIDEFELTHEQVAKNVGKSRASVSNFLRLLNLEKEVQDLLMKDKLDMGHARALLALPKELQFETANTIVEKDLSVRETEKLVQNIIKPKPMKPEASPELITWADELSNKLSSRLSNSVVVKVDHQGKGRVVIPFESTDEVEWLVKVINNKNLS